MSLTTLQIPSDYGFVILSATSTFFIGQWLGIRCGSFRKAAGCGYPALPVSAETIASCANEGQKQALYLYNCALRAHGNFVEYHASVVTGMLLAGLRYPKLAAALGAAWCVSRVMYAVGYTRKDKKGGKGRMVGVHFFIWQWAIWTLSGVTGYLMIAK